MIVEEREVEREDNGGKAAVITAALTGFPNRPLYSSFIYLVALDNFALIDSRAR